MDWIMGILKALANFFSGVNAQHSVNNTPAMKDREIALEDQKIQEEATKAVAEGDLDEIRRNISF